MCTCTIAFTVTAVKEHAEVIATVSPVLNLTLPKRTENVSSGLHMGAITTNALEAGKSLIWDNLKISTTFKYCPNCGKKLEE